MLRPLNDRVLIKPHKSPDETTSGLILPENRAESYAEMQGTVVAVGTPKHPLALDAEQWADYYCRLEYHDFHVEGECGLCEAKKLIEKATAREPCVSVGDDVLFSWNVGQKVTIDDEEFLLMRESDLLAVLESV